MQLPSQLPPALNKLSEPVSIPISSTLPPPPPIEIGSPTNVARSWSPGSELPAPVVKLSEVTIRRVSSKNALDEISNRTPTTNRSSIRHHIKSLTNDGLYDNAIRVAYNSSTSESVVNRLCKIAISKSETMGGGFRKRGIR
ncbi:hypothetical protein HOH87_01330 [bacterium]|jgi:hypothetical protein|nr:hypothetical protein [bacterium]